MSGASWNVKKNLLRQERKEADFEDFEKFLKVPIQERVKFSLTIVKRRRTEIEAETFELSPG